MSQTNLTQLDFWLAQYEAKYQMISSEFSAKFLAETLPVTPDFLEWKTFYELREQALADTSNTKHKKFCNG